MIAFILTIVLFIAKGDPIALTKAFSTEEACMAKQVEVLNKAIPDPCIPVREANKI